MHIKSWISCRKKRDIAKEYNMLAHQRRPAFRYCECLGFCATALNAFVVFFSGATKRSMRILRKAPKSHTERFGCGRMNTYGNWCDTFTWRNSHEISVCEQSPMFWLCNAHTHTHTPTNTLIRRPPLVRRFRCVFYGLAIPLCRLTCPAGISLILDTITKIRNDAKDIERRVCDFAADEFMKCVLYCCWLTRTMRLAFNSIPFPRWSIHTQMYCVCIKLLAFSLSLYGTV